jgi:glucokinase-like ROK family protein
LPAQIVPLLYGKQMTKRRAADHSFVRELNLSAILYATRDYAPLSRAQLAAKTGLNKTTVSSLVKELISAQFIHEIGTQRGDEIGRPAVLLKLNPKAGYIIGVEIGVDFILVALANFDSKIVWRHHEQTTELADQASILERAVQLIRTAVAEAERAGMRILGLGLGVPGLMDRASGTLLMAPNLGWHNVPLQQILAREFDFPSFVDNEANMATLGESYFGAARDAKSVLYVSAGVGLGGGLSIDGRIVNGANGFAGEIGHMRLVANGLKCNCGGTGCWETLVSQRAVIQRVRMAIELGQPSLLTERTNGNPDRLTIHSIIQAARDGDAVALDAFEETGTFMGLGLANLINALNPERVVLGGILSLAYEFLRPAILRRIEEIALAWSLRGTKILVAEHGFDACVMGGVAMVYDSVLAQPKNCLSGFARNN